MRRRRVLFSPVSSFAIRGTAIIWAAAIIAGCGSKTTGSPGTGGSGAGGNNTGGNNTGGNNAGGSSTGGSGTATGGTGGAAGMTGGGSGGGVGSGGAAPADGGPDVSAGGHGCGPTPTPRTYTLTKLFNMTTGEGRAFPIPRGSVVPMAVYKGMSTSGANRIVASTMPLIEGDGGITSTTYNATPIAQAETFSPADVRFTGSSAVRMTYLASSVTGYKVRYLEWSGDLAQTPTDAVVGTDTSFTSATALPVIALDAADRAFVAYYANDSSLRLATHSGTGWTVETVVSNVFAANTEFALAVDAGGQPYLFMTGMGTFGDGGVGSDGLSVLTKGTNGWSSTSLHSDASDHFPRGARTASGEVEVLFTSQGAIARAVLRAGSWQVDAPLGPPGAGIDSASGFEIAIGAGDVVHVAARNSTHVVHLAYNDCEWFRETVDSESALQSGFGIALDAAGNAHVAYQKNATGPTGQTHEIWYATPQP
jgi:hypothetical protein